MIRWSIAWPGTGGQWGLAAVIFGLLAFLQPGAAATVLVVLFGAYALWDGVFALVAAFRSQGSRRWALILEGVIGVVAGVLTFLWPNLATVSLLLIIAAWAVLTGIAEIIAAIRLREEIEGEWLLLLGGLLSVAFGVAAALWPAAGVLAITWVIATYATLFGILLLMLAFRLRGWSTEHTAPAAR
jgi:uncharacterized membrane protein HdeD (DUF308 family)